MSFVGKAIRGVVKGITNVLGLTPSAPTPQPIVPIPMVSPSATSDATNATLDAAAQRQAAALQGGRTSTVLNEYGGKGFEEDAKNTSKVLLGQ